VNDVRARNDIARDTAFMDPVMVAALFAIVGTIVTALIFEIFRTRYRLVDVAAASVLSAVATMVPTYGGSISLIVMVLVLHWRVRADLFPDIVLAVGASRLALVPVLLLAQVNPPPFF
jgi:steroid 5-alpha reductase family enzyme